MKNFKYILILIFLIITFFLVFYATKVDVLYLIDLLLIYLSYKKKKYYIIPIIVGLSIFFINSINDINKKPFLRGHINNIYNEQDKQEVITNQDIKNVSLDNYKSIEKILYKEINENPLNKVPKGLYKPEFYMQLCLFFNEKQCVVSYFYKMKDFYLIEDYETDEVTNKRIRKNDNDVLRWYQRTYYIPFSKEDLLLYGYYNINIDKKDKNYCMNLFYAAQNGWEDKKQELIKEIKSNNNCMDTIIEKLDFIPEYLIDRWSVEELKNQKEKMKNDFLNFLINKK